MKMTKIESARIIAESTDNPACRSIFCSKCFNSRKGKTCKDGNLVVIEKAKAYIKQHESKSKKKPQITIDEPKLTEGASGDIKPEEPIKVTRPNFRKYLRDKIDMKVRVTPEIVSELEKICAEEGVYHWNRQSFKTYLDNPYMLINSRGDCEYSVVFSYKDRESIAEYNPETDTLVEKVEEPKPIKTVGIDNSDVTLALTAQHEPTPLEIAKMIRDDWYRCLKVSNCKGCPLRLVRNCGNGTEFAINEERKLRRQLIDSYISANEPVKEHQPIKLPDFVYSAHKFGIGFVETENRTFTTNEKGELLLNGNPCFATPEEALHVAKKLWNGEGK